MNHSEKENKPPESGASFWILGALAGILAISPLGEEPHLWQKLVLLWFGWLQTPLDWLDLAMHGVPITVFLGLGIRKLWLRFSVNSGNAGKNPKQNSRNSNR